MLATWKIRYVVNETSNTNKQPEWICYRSAEQTPKEKIIFAGTVLVW